MTGLEVRRRTFDTRRKRLMMLALFGMGLGQCGRAWAAQIPGDTAPPQITFTVPRPNGFVNSLASINGNAVDNPGVTDGGGVASVTIVLKRNMDGRYWNGVTWGLTPVALPTDLQDEQLVYSLGVSWTAPAAGSALPSGNQLGSGTFTVTASATDESGNVGKASETLTADTTPASLSILTPRDGTVVTNLETHGSAREASTGSGVEHVEFTIRRHSDDRYWNGTAWIDPQPVAGPYYPPAELLVGSYNNGIIREFQTGNGQPVRDFARGLKHPETIIFGPDQNSDGYPELYACDRDNSRILFYDGRTRRQIGVFARDGGLHDPAGIAFMPKTAFNSYPDLLVATGYTGGTTSTTSIKRFDGRTRVYKGDFVTAAGNGGVSNGYEDIIFGPDANGDGSSDLYAAALIEGKVAVYNGNTGVFIKNFVAAGAGGLKVPTGLTFGPDANTDNIKDLYVCSSSTDDIKVYNGKTGAYIRDLIADNNGATFGLDGPERLAFGPDGRLYITNFGTPTNNVGDGTAVLRFSIVGTTGVPAPSAGKTGAVFADDSIPGPAGLAFNPMALGFSPPPDPPAELVPPALTTNYNASTGLYARSSGMPTGNNLQRGLYTIVATSYDYAGNKTTATSTVTVGAAPTVSITTPANGSTVASLTAISGSALGDAIQTVQLYLRRNSDGLYWTGSAWGARTALSTVLTAQASPKGVSFTRNTGLPSGANLTAGTYNIDAVATNDLGQTASAATNFTVKTSGGTGTSQVTLSTTTATASTSTIKLSFTGALDAATAASTSRYVITINGATVGATQAIYSASAASVQLKVPTTTLHGGDTVQVSYNLLDSTGRTVIGQSDPVVAAK